MPKFIKFEDNEDGTMSGTADFGDGEQSFLMPFGFDDFLRQITASPEILNHAREISEDIVRIPNNPEEG